MNALHRQQVSEASRLISRAKDILRDVAKDGHEAFDKTPENLIEARSHIKVKHFEIEKLSDELEIVVCGLEELAS